MKFVEGAVQTIPSYEVAEMMSRRHGRVLEMIEGKANLIGIKEVLAQHNFVFSDYFIEGTYKDASGKQNKYYECTKMGCELLANKMTGEKGILFTARYVKRFNEMEKQIKQGDLPSIMIEDKYLAIKKYEIEMRLHDIEKNELKINQLEEEYSKLEEQLKNLLLVNEITTFDQFNRVANAMVKLVAEKTENPHANIWNTFYKFYDEKYGKRIIRRVNNARRKLQKERESQGKKPYKESTLKSKVPKLSVIKEDEYEDFLELLKAKLIDLGATAEELENVTRLNL